METRITFEELTAKLGEILHRVAGGERFRVEEDGQALAILEPPPKSITWGEFLELWDSLPKPDDDYWRDLEAARRSQPRLPDPPWDS